MGRYRGRHYLFVHLSSEDNTLSLVNQSTSVYNPDPSMHLAFTQFDKSTIDTTIKSARSTEADQTIKASNVPPELDKQTLHMIFGRYSEIDRIAVIKKEPYNIVYVVYKKATNCIQFNDMWSVYYKKESIRITPLKLSEQAIKDHTQFVIKLTGLPLFCYAKDLEEIGRKLNAKSIHVLRERGDVRPGTIAYLYFESDDELANATMKFA